MTTPYGLTPYASHAGGYGVSFKHPTLGLTRGGNRPTHLYKVDLNVDVEDEDEDEDEELDRFVYDLDNEIQNALHSRIGSNYAGGTDKSRADRAYLVGNNGILEMGRNHMTPIRKGISPFPHKKMTGPPIGTGAASQAFKTTGNYRRTGTQYGTSRSHKILVDDDISIFNLSDMADKMEMSFLKQQNRIKKLLSLLEECLS